jgi:DNA-binding CsgD family transcriptional regulator
MSSIMEDGSPLGALERGRAACRDRDWNDAYEALATAHDTRPLEPHDLALLATAAHLVGREEEAADLWAHAHQECLREEDPAGAARCAFWLGFTLVNRGEHARGGGWFARARRVLDESGAKCVEEGYLLLPEAMQAVGQGDLESALARFRQAGTVGERFGEVELITLARQGEGRILIRMGDTARGAALLDEAMVAVTGGEVESLVAGDVYCSVLEACQELFDPRRAREWTRAMTGWMRSQPGLVPYRGQCLVHRSEVLQWSGAWDEALEEAREACRWLTRPPAQPAAGAAFYQQAELHRLRGEVEPAEEGYREAHRRGRRPEPGLPLLRLTQGRADAAAASLRRALGETRAPWTRATLLPPAVEVYLAAGEVEEARGALQELQEVAAERSVGWLQAAALAAEGALCLEEGAPEAALTPLRRSGEEWFRLEIPYEAARTRMLLGRVCRELGDGEAARLELEAARETFRELGARPDLRRLEALLPRSRSSGAHGLTPRQVEVLRHLAGGATNRAIARTLFISERTVERHVSNIFRRLGVSSRAAATAWAYEHDLA